MGFSYISANAAGKDGSRLATEIQFYRLSKMSTWVVR
jgi:hypothetical protein